MGDWPAANDEACVAIVEDDAVVRRFFSSALRPLPVKVQEYEGQQAFLASLDTAQFDCAIVDLCLPDGDGLEIAKVLRARFVPTSLVLVSGYANVRVAVDAMQGGAIDVLEKAISSETLVTAVKRGIELARQRRAQLQQLAETQSQLDQLSPGEQQVLELVLQGEPNKRIAKQLGVSQRTVEARRSEIYRKLNVDSVSELVSKVLAVRNHGKQR
jgi:FixJ family two-component response regulator